MRQARCLRTVRIEPLDRGVGCRPKTTDGLLRALQACFDSLVHRQALWARLLRSAIDVGVELAGSGKG